MHQRGQQHQRVFVVVAEELVVRAFANSAPTMRERARRGTASWLRGAGRPGSGISAETACVSPSSSMTPRAARP
jgi:hypothetical protein